MYYQQTLVMLLLLLGILCLIKSVLYLFLNDSIESPSPLKQPIKKQQLTGNVACNSCFAGIMH